MAEDSGSPTPNTTPGQIQPLDIQPFKPFEGSSSMMPAPKFTPDDELDLLFDPTVIPASMHEDVGPDFHASPLDITFRLEC